MRTNKNCSGYLPRQCIHHSHLLFVIQMYKFTINKREWIPCVRDRWGYIYSPCNQIVLIISVPVQTRLSPRPPPDNGPDSFLSEGPRPRVQQGAACGGWLVPDPITGSRDTQGCWCHPPGPSPPFPSLNTVPGARLPGTRHHNSYVLTIPNLGSNWLRSSPDNYLTNSNNKSQETGNRADQRIYPKKLFMDFNLTKYWNRWNTQLYNIYLSGQGYLHFTIVSKLFNRYTFRWLDTLYLNPGRFFQRILLVSPN